MLLALAEEGLGHRRRVLVARRLGARAAVAVARRVGGLEQRDPPPQHAEAQPGVRLPPPQVAAQHGEQALLAPLRRLQLRRLLLRRLLHLSQLSLRRLQLLRLLGLRHLLLRLLLLLLRRRRRLVRRGLRLGHLLRRLLRCLLPIPRLRELSLEVDRRRPEPAQLGPEPARLGLRRLQLALRVGERRVGGEPLGAAHLHLLGLLVELSPQQAHLALGTPRALRRLGQELRARARVIARLQRLQPHLLQRRHLQLQLARARLGTLHLRGRLLLGSGPQLWQPQLARLGRHLRRQSTVVRAVYSAPCACASCACTLRLGRTCGGGRPARSASAASSSSSVSSSLSLA